MNIQQITDLVERSRADGNDSLTTAYLIIAELQQEVAELRTTNTRLNRRCQVYEKGLADKAREIDGSPSMGRAFANATAESLARKLDELRGAATRVVHHCGYDINGKCVNIAGDPEGMFAAIDALRPLTLAKLTPKPEEAEDVSQPD